MTERPSLRLSDAQKQLRERRAQALERLNNPSPEPAPAARSELRSAPSSAQPPLRQPAAERTRPLPPARPSPGPAARPYPPPATRLQADLPARTHSAPRATAAEATLRPQATAAEGTRLNKRMAELGMCSRREGDAWIEKGWVTVNGQVAVMGMLVQASDRIEVAEAAKGEQKHLVTILLNKPMGFVSAQAEDGHQPAIALINPRSHWVEDGARIRFANHQLQGLAPAGRLDIDSVGLLVLTQDGRVARQLIVEDSEVEKEYLVRVTYATTAGDVATDVQAVFPPERLALLRHGLSLDGEPLKPAQVEWQNPEQLRFVLNQGKKRQIRRMCEQVGLKVVGLKRIRMGKVTLGNLPVGQWRYLGAHERF